MPKPSSNLKQDFLQKWVLGLQVCSTSKKEMSILERKNAIKLTADVAMASARNGSTHWSRALIANASENCDNEFIVDHILGNNSEKNKNASNTSFSHNKMVNKSRKIIKKTRKFCRVKKMAPKMAVKSSIVAKSLVKKRTQVLKRLVPGGEFIDEFLLLEETLDYIRSLKAQVDVMKFLANATENLNCN